MMIPEVPLASEQVVVGLDQAFGVEETDRELLV